MKKLFSILTLSVAAATVGYSQGTLTWSSTAATYAISTNTTLGVSGKIFSSGTDANGYYFALLYSTAASAPAAFSATTSASWTLATTGKNYLTAGSSQSPGTTTLPVAGGSSVFIELVGWSASEGTSYSALLNTLGTGFAPGFYGESGVDSFVTGGGGSPSGPPNSIFSQVSGIPSGFDLNQVPVPEPTTIALAGLGGLSLLAFRRKKA
jgi:hypothetical protein